MNKVLNILRWIAIPFVSWLSYKLLFKIAAFIVIFIYARDFAHIDFYSETPALDSISHFLDDIKDPNYQLPELVRIILSVVANIVAVAGSMIIVGYLVPKYKRIVPMIVGLLFLILLSVMYAFLIYNGISLSIIIIAGWIAVGVGVVLGTLATREFFEY